MAQEKKNVRDYYDRMAGKWAEKWYADDSMTPLLENFLSQLPQNPRVLDLCCGAGYETMRMARLGARMVGIDLSGESIRIAREKNPDIPFHVDDMLNDYSYVGETDGIACIAGLVHLPEEKLRPAFERMAAVLRPGGRVLMVVRDGTGRQAQSSDVEIDGEQYDRAFFAHTLEELERESQGILAFEREICDPEPSIWRNYVFKKVV